MPEKVSKEAFEKVVAENRHKEIVLLLKQLIGAAEGNEKSIELVANRILNLPAPQVNVKGNQEQVVNSVEQMTAAILTALIEIKRSVDAKPREWEFKVKRDLNSGGYISSITATQKN